MESMNLFSMDRSVANPDLQMEGGGAGHLDPEIRGWKGGPGLCKGAPLDLSLV